MMLVVSDATPLISLMKAGRLEVLKALFGRVLVPDAVYREVTTSERFKDEAEVMCKSSFIEIVSVDDREAVEELRSKAGLDLGESEAIVYARDNKAYRLLMDEELGRITAKNLGIRVMGTVGILTRAYEQGILSVVDVEDAFGKMKVAKRHISETLLHDALDYIYKREAKASPTNNNGRNNG